MFCWGGGGRRGGGGENQMEQEFYLWIKTNQINSLLDFWFISFPTLKNKEYEQIVILCDIVSKNSHPKTANRPNWIVLCSLILVNFYKNAV